MLSFLNFKISKNYLYTFITEFIILILSVLIYKLAALNLGTIGFSEYSLSRRTFSFLQPLVSLGIGVGISRYIAFKNESLNNFTDTYFISGIIILLTANIFFSIIINVFSHPLAFLFFGDAKYYILMFPISLMLIGTVCHFACYSYFRGKIMSNHANILQLLNIGIIPFVIIIFCKDLRYILLFTGSLWILVSFVFFLATVMKHLKIQSDRIVICGKELFYYGIQRIPGDILITGFLSLPAFLISHTNGILIGGYVAFGMALLNMTGAFFAPLSLVLLPEASALISTNNFPKLKLKSFKILKYTLLITVTGLVFAEILMKLIIKLYLGPGYFDSIIIVRIILLASIGYTIYIALRSVLDAYYIKAMNTKNILYSFIVMVALSFSLNYFFNNYLVILISFVFSMIILGLLTTFETIKIFKDKHV